MSLFDLIAGALIAVSALMGYQRGAVNEVVGLFAFSLSAFAALAALPLSTPIAASFFHPHWIAVAAAVVISFALIYFTLNLIARWLTGQLHQTAFLGGANRVAGLGMGALRALILLGLFALVFDRATPDRLKPEWVTSAFFYPLAAASGRLIGKVAPTSLRAFGHPGALLNGDNSPDTTKTNETGDPPATPTPARRPGRHHGAGYNQRSRDQIDTLVERTR